MITKKNVVLVLGAGASYPYGFPVGKKLIEIIVSDIISRGGWQRLVKLTGLSQDKIMKFAARLEQSKFESIDEFLVNNIEYLDLGKFAIASALIPYEELNNLTRNLSAGRDGGWYQYFVNRTGKALKDYTERANLSIITFNYDRSLEYFLYESLSASYPVEEEEILKVFDNIEIIHAYGILGEPKFMNDKGRDYNTVIEDEEIIKAKNSLSLMAEGEIDTKRQYQINDIILNANIISFLGFGYHLDNLDLLFQALRGRTLPKKTVIGTIKGLENGELSAIDNYLDSNFNIELNRTGLMLDGVKNDMKNLDFLRFQDKIFP